MLTAIAITAGLILLVFLPFCFAVVGLVLWWLHEEDDGDGEFDRDTPYFSDGKTSTAALNLVTDDASNNHSPRLDSNQVQP